MPPHLYWGLVQLAERQILTLKVKGSSPLPPAKSKSKMDGTIDKSLKNSRTWDQKCPSFKERSAVQYNTLGVKTHYWRFAVNRKQNRFIKI